VRALLGEMVAAAALLSANLKFNGSIVMQIHGDGPVKLLVVECDAEPAPARHRQAGDGAVIADDAKVTELLNVPAARAAS
jgi:molecular chaperone Hsp33